MNAEFPLELIYEISTYLSYKDFKNFNVALKLSLLYSGRNCGSVLDELNHFSSRFINKKIAELNLVNCIHNLCHSLDFEDLLVNLIAYDFVEAVKTLASKFPSALVLNSNCWKSISREMANVVFEAGFNPNHLYEFDKTPLFFVSSSQVASILIQKGADVNARSKDKDETPLLAVDLEYLDIARLLLENGADPNARNIVGETCIHYDINIPFFRLILEFGASINARDDWEITGIYECPDLDLVKLFIINGVNLNNVDIHGRTALFYVETAAMAKLMLTNGADMNIRDLEGLACWEDPSSNEAFEFYKEWRVISNRKRLTRYSSAFLAQ